jgi:hypothetical protein
MLIPGLKMDRSGLNFILFSKKDLYTLQLVTSRKGQGRIRGRFGPQNISSYFTDHPIQKNVVILLVTNLSEIIRIRSHFDGEYLQKIIEFSVDPYLCSISPECRIFLQFFKFDLYWSKRAFNSASFHIRTITISLQNGS